MTFLFYSILKRVWFNDFLGEGEASSPVPHLQQQEQVDKIILSLHKFFFEHNQMIMFKNCVMCIQKINEL